jgi:hypothetical protein
MKLFQLWQIMPFDEETTEEKEPGEAVQTEGFTGLLFDIRAELLTEDVGSLKDR